MSIRRERNGKIYDFRNMLYYPAFLLFPKEILEEVAPELLAIPRSVAEVVRSNKAMDLIASDLYFLLIIDGIACIVWPYMMPKTYIESFSGYDPLWKLAHNPEFWINEWTEMKFLPPVEEMFKDPFLRKKKALYQSKWQLDQFLSIAVPPVLDKYKIGDAIKIIEEHRCFEDFDYRDSYKKTEFYRKWYHTRTNHPMIFLEDYMTKYASEHQGEKWDPPDESQPFENEVDCQVLAGQFMETLDEKDKKILQLRLEGHTLEEVAEKMGYSNHSGVIKRLRKIGLAFERFADVDYGFDGKRILSTY